MKEKQCKYCKKQFEVIGRNQKFCSKRCARKNAWRTYREQRNASDIPMKPHGGNHTGKTGKDHPAYTTGIGCFKTKWSKEYYHSVRYCERCGTDLKDVHFTMYAVHHKDRDRTNNDPSNYELLCKRCHQLEHECVLNFN